ncbi:MAG: hypothetical protein MUC56_08410 [Thermoanaerobaculales bacterium]|jgi:hypothetical protein|nr:hypothetical protein [Thermoanaerobaculales bacterium]
MTAAEAAIQHHAHDPLAALERISAEAARAIEADPATVYRLAGEIVVSVFRARLGKPRSVELLCLSCGAPLPDDRLLCTGCEPEFFSEDPT